MFSNKKDIEQPKNSIDTLIAASTNITGDINASGTVRIDGNYRGNIETKSEVIVGTTGIIVGNIDAENVTVSGTIEGNIKCSGVLEILPSGNISGDVEVNQVSINTGAIFNGKCTMLLESNSKTELIENTGEQEL
jgi:cytoskeletal protein CcmA (bactofilin family)